MTTEDKICKQLEIIAKNLEDINNTLNQTLKSSTNGETLYDAVDTISDVMVQKS